MKLDIRFTSRGIETLWAEVLVGLPFKGAVGESSGLSGLEEKTGGVLRRLWVQGFWKGDLGETLLFPSEGLHAPWVLLKGLGSRERLSARRLNEMFSAAGEALYKLAFRDIGVQVPGVPGALHPFGPALGEACRTLIGGYLNGAGRKPDWIVKMVFCAPSPLQVSLGPVVRSLREEYGTLGPSSFVVEEKAPEV